MINRLKKTSTFFLILVFTIIFLSINIVCDNKSESDITSTETYLHNTTGLRWLKCTIGLNGENCTTGIMTSMTWEESITTCENLDFAGYNDWRLPNIREMYSTTIHYYNDRPRVDGTAFPNTANGSGDFYWSSTSLADGDPNAWVIKTRTGECQFMPKDSDGFVRCVRGPE